MLDKIQIAALRKANIVSFHRLKDGTSHICATKRNAPTAQDPFAQDIDIRIPCDSTLDDYDSPHIDGAPWAAFDMLYVSSYADEWTTVAGLLREGDSVTLEWRRGNRSTTTLKDLGIVADTLMFVVKRGDKRLTFHIGDYTGPDHTARMIRRA